MLPSKIEVTNHVNTLVAQLKAYAVSELDVNVNSLRPNIGFKICGRYGTGGCGKMGEPTMKLNLGYIITYPVVGVHEYRSYAWDPRIGGFKTTEWKDWVDCLVLHEFAHVLQFALIRKHRTDRSQRTVNVPGFGMSESGHGYYFQRIYAKLRAKFLNDRITPHYGNPGQEFLIPDEVKQAERAKKEAKRKAAVVTEHPYIGLKVTFKGRIYTIKEVNTRNRKYPYIGVSADGQRLKIDEFYLSYYKVA